MKSWWIKRKDELRLPLGHHPESRPCISLAPFYGANIKKGEGISEQMAFKYHECLSFLGRITLIKDSEFFCLQLGSGRTPRNHKLGSSSSKLLIIPLQRNNIKTDSGWLKCFRSSWELFTCNLLFLGLSRAAFMNRKWLLFTAMFAFDGGLCAAKATLGLRRRIASSFLRLVVCWIWNKAKNDFLFMALIKKIRTERDLGCIQTDWIEMLLTPSCCFG